MKVAVIGNGKVGLAVFRELQEIRGVSEPASNLGNLTKSCASTPVEVAHTDAQGSCGVALTNGRFMLYFRQTARIVTERISRYK